MTQQQNLFLHEEVMLLALKDAAGTIGVANWTFAMGGAILAELLLSKRIET